MEGAEEVEKGDNQKITRKKLKYLTIKKRIK